MRCFYYWLFGINSFALDPISGSVGFSNSKGDATYLADQPDDLTSHVHQTIKTSIAVLPHMLFFIIGYVQHDTIGCAALSAFQYSLASAQLLDPVNDKTFDNGKLTWINLSADRGFQLNQAYGSSDTSICSWA